MHHLTIVPAAPPLSHGCLHQECALTSRDLIAVTCWMQRADGHGYGRVLIENGAGGGRPEAADYVLIYSPDSEWASWGIARDDEGVLVWHCGSGTDLGRFDTMLDALESLPPAFRRPAAWAPKPIHVRPRLSLVHSV